MNEYYRIVRTTVRFTIFTTLVWFILWMVLPLGKPILLGLAIGSAASIYFAISASRQAEATGQIAMKAAGGKPGLQYANRLLVVLAAVLISQAISERWGEVSLPAVVIGLFLYHVLLAGVYLSQKFASKINKREG